MSSCGQKCEVYSRVCGYFRPVSNWNFGKKEEFKERKTFAIDKLNQLNYQKKLIETDAGVKE